MLNERFSILVLLLILLTFSLG
nr:RecName: Full=Endo-1,4-beta-xylanase A; Short=Xylanase A; AltName: Full=1,4-beta-D-xylan xylanohydrolase A [Dictyoglomus sp. B4A]